MGAPARAADPVRMRRLAAVASADEPPTVFVLANAALTRMLGRLLRSRGYAVVEAGATAAPAYDVAVVDLDEGELPASPVERDEPTIYLSSAWPAFSPAHLTSAAGSVIHKPFPFEVLERELERVLVRRGLDRSVSPHEG